MKERIIELLKQRQQKHERKESVLENRLCGIEHEFAVILNAIEDDEKRDEYLQDLIKGRHYFENGGETYIDLKHLEGCTPIVDNTLDLLRYEKAMEQQIFTLIDKNLNPMVYKTNRDAKVSFGSHLNFSTTIVASEEARAPLLLWSVIEKVITGAGYHYLNGRYDLLQRRPFILEPFSNCTTQRRALLNLRDQGDFAPWKRFHHISNDGNMCESAVVLKTELWRCMLDLAEANLLPHIPYDTQKAVSDMYSLSEQQAEWSLEGTPVEYRRLTDVYKKYCSAIKGELYGQNAFRDSVIDCFEETVKLLARIKEDPYALAGRLDWVTKKYLIEQYMTDTGLDTGSALIQSIGLDYHRIDSGGLFYQIQDNDGWIERWITEEEIINAMHAPPQTIAAVKGKAATYKNKGLRNGGRIELDWNRIAVFDGQANRLWEYTLESNQKPDNAIQELEQVLTSENFI